MDNRAIHEEYKQYVRGDIIELGHDIAAYRQ